MPTPDNILYYGDNLDILRNRDYFPNECVDLIYLDPPFNSARSYNVLFKDESGRASEAQITAFEDTWHWGPQAEYTYASIVQNGTPRVSKAISALRDLLGENQMMAYLVMMAARLVELHRVLKPTGSMYLHCDPTASHYLKIVLDTIFGAENFANEIIWKRTTTKNDHKQGSKNLPRVHDVILFYYKNVSTKPIYNQPFAGYDEKYVASKYRHKDSEERLYRLDNLTGPGGASKGNAYYEFLGVTRYWRYSRENMEALYAEGRIIQTKPGTVPQYKRYLDEMGGVSVGDVWDDILPINSQARERLGYPTQKPVSLVERIIEISSKPGDVVLDPFCGCGTAIAAAQKLGRRWLGIDITHLSIALQKYRLQDMFNLKPGDYRVIGEPEDLHSAQALAKDSENDGRYQFQWWALSLVRAKPLGQAVSGGREGKKGSDKGVDGVIHFIDGTGKAREVLVQVKSGKVKSGDIRDLRGTMERLKSEIGVFITLEPPSRDMTSEAASAGVYELPMKDAIAQFDPVPRVQILTIEALLKGASIKMPPHQVTFKQADQVKAQPSRQNRPLLDLDADAE